MQGANYIGGVAGYELGAVTNCKVTGEIVYLSQNNFGVFLGGIAGRAENDLNGRTAEVAITANEVGGTAYAGGIAGYCAYNMQNAESAITLASRSAVTFTKTESNSNTAYAGGIFGYVAEKMNLQDCFAEGNIVITEEYSNSYAGGLVGEFGDSNTLMNCYATGNITVNAQSSNTVYAGGLVGYFSSRQNTIQNSYSTSEIVYTGAAQTAHLGGLVGYAQEVTFTNAHWLYFAESGVEYAVGTAKHWVFPPISAPQSIPTLRSSTPLPIP